MVTFRMKMFLVWLVWAVVFVGWCDLRIYARNEIAKAAATRQIYRCQAIQAPEGYQVVYLAKAQ